MKKSLATAASLILSVFFICIMLFIMIAVVDITESENGTVSIFFSVVDFVILLGVVGFGKFIFKAIKTGMYTPLCAVTIVYMILSFGATFGLFSVIGTALFTAVKLILLFIYCCIIIPLAVIGMNSEHDEENRPEIKKHNL